MDKKASVLAAFFTPLRCFWLAAVLGAFVVANKACDLSVSWGVVALVALCFACELMDSSLGMGYGTTLAPILIQAGYDPLDLVPMILISELLTGFAASFFHSEAGNVDFSRRSQHLRAAIVLSAGSIVGVAIGAHVAFRLPAQGLKILIGCVILAAGACIWIHINRPVAYSRWKMLGLATVASFNKAVSGGGYGPLMTSGQVLSGIEGKAAVAITSFAEGFTCLAGSAFFLAEGRGMRLELLVPFATGALLSVPFSAGIVHIVNERKLKLAIAAITILLGLWTLVQALK